MTTPTVQQQWASRLRSIPDQFGEAVAGANDAALRHRPAPGEWSAVEVLGHMVDKMTSWNERVTRIASDYHPPLSGWDQDALVRERGYQQADPTALLRELREACETFAALVETVPDSGLEWIGVHSENGPITIRQCVESPLSSAVGHLAQLKDALAAYR